jgi:oligosaccharide repeat unit polymerase
MLPLGAILSPEPAVDLELIHMANKDQLTSIHYLLHFYLAVVFISTFLICKNNKTRSNFSFQKIKRDLSFKAHWIACFGALLLIGQFARQLGAAGWSLTSWLDFNLGPRFGRPWDGQLVGGGEFIFTFLSSLFPLAGIALAFGINFQKDNYRYFYIPAYLMVLFMQVCDGSRTPMALSLLSFGAMWWISKQNAIRYLGVACTLALFVFLVSLMISFRQEGLVNLGENKDLGTIEYHQDDNYFRLVNVILVEDSGMARHWNPFTFFTAALLNPIPRFFWPGKPLLDQEFYGYWKWSFVTISYLGEWIAMFGKWFGISMGLVYACANFVILDKLYTRLARPGGLIIYIAFAFYLYMTGRSIFNIGMYAPFIGVLFFVVWFFLRRNHSAKINLGSRRKFRRPLAKQKNKFLNLEKLPTPNED